MICLKNSCPSWWDCNLRGCFEQAKLDYADPKITGRQGRSYEYAGRRYWRADGSKGQDQQEV